eukprot:scaffold3734_cov425-Prasinococcus_capsulatus_cf.AAC.21
MQLSRCQRQQAGEGRTVELQGDGRIALPRPRSRGNDRIFFTKSARGPQKARRGPLATSTLAACQPPRTALEIVAQVAAGMKGHTKKKEEGAAGGAA